MVKRTLYVPPEFAEMFIRNGCTKCEEVWGKGSIQRYRRAIGIDVLKKMKKELRGD